MTASALGVNYAPLTALLAVLSFVLYTFSTLTTEVSARGVTVWFGLPIDKVTFHVRDIVACEHITDVAAWWGADLRRPSKSAPTEWYGVGNSEGVALRLTSGRRIVIGTGQPDALRAAIPRVTLAGEH